MRTSAFVIACLFSSTAALKLKQHAVAKSNPRYAQLMDKLANQSGGDSGGDSGPEEEEVKEIFDYMDANNDGAVTKEEGKAAIEQYCGDHPGDCPPLDEKFWNEAGKFFDMVDANSDGKITWDEVEQAMGGGPPPASFAQLKAHIVAKQKQENGPDKEDIKEIFDYMDANNDGAVTKDEAQAAIVKYCGDNEGACPPLDDEFWKEAEAFFDAVDANSDGKITWKEVKQAMDQGDGGGGESDHEHSGDEGDDGTDFCPSSRAEAKEIFQAMDANSDGFVTKKEGHDAIVKYCGDNEGACPPLDDDFWNEARKVFELIDANNDGKISIKEAKKAYKKYCSGGDAAGDAAGSAALSQIMSKANDSDFDPSKEEAKQMFDALDTNGDGAVTMKEGKKAIEDFCAANAGVCPPLDEEFWKGAKAAFQHADANSDGKVTWKEVEALYN